MKFLVLGITTEEAKLVGVCEPENELVSCTIYSSVEGGRYIQINGEGFKDTAQDQQVLVTQVDITPEVALTGTDVSRDDNFLSNIAKGKLTYLLPSMEELLGTQVTEQGVFQGILSVKGSDYLLQCLNNADCKITYSMAYTPTVHSIYPSTVYSGQQICFDVFTDLATNGGNKAFLSGKIGNYNIDHESYSEENDDNVSNKNNYQLCANVGDVTPQADNPLTMTAQLGKYLISDFAYSYDASSKYLVRTIPKIDLLQTNTLFKAEGSIISIRGEGFYPDISKNEVTVDDLACTVLEASETEIKCSLPEKTATTSGNLFVGSTGARVKIYSEAKTSITGSSTSVREDYFTDLTSVRNALEEGEKTRVAETWFVPPQDGNYTFYAICDDYCFVELSTTDMDKDSATEIISITNYQWFRNYYDLSTTAYKSTQQELLEGKHYYMKVFHQDNGGDDHMTIGMSIEDDSTPKPNSKSEWKRLIIDPQHTYEQFEFVIPNHASAKFKIQFLHSSKCAKLTKSNVLTDCVDINTCPCVTTAFSADTSVGAFKNDIKYYFNKKIKTYYGDTLTVTKLTLDAAGQETTVVADITTIKFSVKAKMALGSSSFSGVEIFSNVNGLTTKGQMLQNSTLPLSGMYKIRVNRIDSTVIETEDLSLDSKAYLVKRKISEVAPEYKKGLLLKIKRRSANFPTESEGIELIYRTSIGYNPELEIIGSSEEPLTGGDETMGISITKDIYEAGSNAPFYESIPAEFLRTVETKPQITVKSNGRLSACPLETFCDIQFIDDVAEITSRSVSDSFADKIFDFVGTSIPKDELMYVSVGTLRTCDIDYGKTVSVNNLSCILLNAMSGKHPVTVQTTKGALKNSASLGTWDLFIAVSSVSPTTIGPNGGRKITIEGDYFPLSLEEVSRIPDFSLTIGGNDCTLISIERTKIICSSPAGLTVGSTPSLQLSFNSQSYTYGTTFTIQASAGSVTSVSPALVSPPIKQNVNIVVSDTPSSNPDDYVAVLEGPTNTVMMRVNSVDQSTKTLVARYPGSPDNIEYTLYIQHGDDRFNSNVKLQAMSVITGVSITTSGTTKSSISTSGGDIVVITGTGFSSTLSDNKVVFGKAEATVISGSETELTVRAAYSQKTGDVDVQVFIKLSVESSCSMSNGCVINYDANQAPTLDYMMSELTPSDGGIIIAGSGFGTNPRAFVGEHEQKIVASNSTEIEVELTKIDNIESFYVEVRTDTINLPPVAVKLPMIQSLVSISPHIGSTGGEKLTLSTIGIGLKDSSAFDLYYKDNSNVVSVCETFTIIDSTQLTCITKHDLTISQKELKLSFSHKSVKTGKSSIRTLSCAVSTNCQYATTTAATPTISSVSKTNGNTKLDVTIDNFSFDFTYTAKVYYGKQEVDSDTISSTTVVTGSFSDGFTPGKATIRVALTKGDRTTFTASHQETVPLSASSSPITQCSWAGGCVLNIAQTSIKQGALNKDVSVSVCGNKASIGLDESTNDNLVVWTPPYATTHSLDDYKVSDAQVMTGTVTSNPVENGKLAFDGITSTQFTSNTNNCFVQVKFTDGKVGRLSKLKYFMNRMTDKQTNFVNKLKFQASSDGTAWTDVFAADIYLREGWNEYKPNTYLKYQYYRFFSATKIACQVGEIELWGNEVEDTTASSKVCDVVVTAAGDQTQTFSSHVTYKDSASSVVSGISPRYGTYKGGETVTFTGTGFSTTTSEATVTIDGITCTVTSATSTQIQVVLLEPDQL